MLDPSLPSPIFFPLAKTDTSHLEIQVLTRPHALHITDSNKTSEKGKTSCVSFCNLLYVFPRDTSPVTELKFSCLYNKKNH